MENYPETATERFDDANFHINYCLSTVKKYISGNILEVGAGCGSFTRNYINTDIKKITLTELDSFNIENVVFAKLDIEGYEPKALRGGEKTFRRDKPVLCVEINRDVETQKLLESWGYVFQQVDDIVGHDYFFVHKDFLG